MVPAQTCKPFHPSIPQTDKTSAFMRALTEAEAEQATFFLERLVVCLDRVGSSFPNKEDRALALDYVFTKNKIFQEAAQVRKMLHSKYDCELKEEEEYDELERMCKDLEYYKLPSHKQLTSWKSRK